MKNIKEICKKLSNESCFYRNPQTNFIRILGEDVVKQLLDKNYLKVSPKIGILGNRDYTQPCYEFTKKFRIVFHFYTYTFWEFIKYWVIAETIEDMKDNLKLIKHVNRH